MEDSSDYIKKVKDFVRKLNLNSHIRNIIEDEEKNLDTELRSKIFDQITKLQDYSDIEYSDYKNYTMDIEPRTYNLHDSYAKMKIVYNKVINDETIEFFSDEINYHKQGAELERLKRERAEEEEEKERYKQFRMGDTEVLKASIQETLKMAEEREKEAERRAQEAEKQLRILQEGRPATAAASEKKIKGLEDQVQSSSRSSRSKQQQQKK